MSLPAENLTTEFANELQQTNARYTRFVQKAEAQGLTQLAKFFRAFVVSETVRSKLILHGMNAHAEENPDFFICPHCGLFYINGTPDKCPVDETPGDQFEKISS